MSRFTGSFHFDRSLYIGRSSCTVLCLDLNVSKAMRGLQTSYRKSDVELDEHDGHFKDQIASFHYFKETVTLMISSAAKNFLNSVP